jgi:hypothetical protein
VTLFAICPRVGSARLVPRVCEALRVFGSRVCDNALSVFRADVARVAGALTRVFALLREEKQRQLLEQQQQQQQPQAAEGGGGADSGPTTPAPTSPSKPAVPSLHFRMRRTEEEQGAIARLAARLRVAYAASTAPSPADAIDGMSDEDLATKCRARGTDRLRPLGQLCPIVWAEEAPDKPLAPQIAPPHARAATQPAAAATAAAAAGKEGGASPGAAKRTTSPASSEASSAASPPTRVARSASEAAAAKRARRMTEHVASACSDRHWEAAQALLAKFVPVSASVAAANAANPTASQLQQQQQQQQQQPAGGNAAAVAGAAGANAAARGHIVPFSFTGRFHETRWNLRGFLFCVTSSPPFAHAREYAAAAVELRELLPSVFLPTREMFPAIDVSRQTGGARGPQAGAESQQALASWERVKPNQERVTAQFFADDAGQFYRRFRAGVEALPADARQCVLPTVALFPAFSGRM